MIAETQQPMSIAALEKELGIGKETLRVWERRYGFPQPLRGPAGDRLYPHEQVARLRLVRRLLDRGHRPGKLLSLPEQALRSLIPAPATGAQEQGPQAELIALLRKHDDDGLESALRSLILRDGLRTFVMDTVPSLVRLIGERWQSGELEIFEEHLLTEMLNRILREALLQIPAGGSGPRVLTTTLPDEPHALGLLLAEAVMRLAGARCSPLGTGTPEQQILAAVRDGRTDVVALSFSGYFSASALREAVPRLRDGLPADVELWCGGGGVAHLRKVPAGVWLLTRLEDIETEMARWRAMRSAA